MPVEKHTLRTEFPEYVEQIRQLKQNNNHFANLLEQYDEVDSEINKIEQGLEPVADDYAEQLKFKRLTLKDELFEFIKAEKATA
jgi:hypothetical protein